MNKLFEKFIESCNGLACGNNIQSSNSFILSTIDTGDCWILAIEGLSKNVVDFEQIAVPFFSASLLHSAIRARWHMLEEVNKERVLEVMIRALYSYIPNSPIFTNVRKQLCPAIAAALSRSFFESNLEVITTMLCTSADKDHDSAISTLRIFQEIPREHEVLLSSDAPNVYKDSPQTQWLPQLRNQVQRIINSIFLNFIHKTNTNDKLIDLNSDLLLLQSALSCMSSWCSSEIQISGPDSQNGGAINSTWLSLQHLVAVDSENSGYFSQRPHSVTSSLGTVLQLVQPLLQLVDQRCESSQLVGGILQLLMQTLSDLLSWSTSWSTPALLDTDSDADQAASDMSTLSQQQIAAGILQIFSTVSHLWSWVIGDLSLWHRQFITSCDIRSYQSTASHQTASPLQGSGEALVFAQYVDLNMATTIAELQRRLSAGPLFHLQGGAAILNTAVDMILFLLEKHSGLFVSLEGAHDPANEPNVLSPIQDLSTLLLVVATSPDVNTMSYVFEFLPYIHEHLPRHATQNLVGPLFFIYVHQMRVPGDIDDELMLRFYDSQLGCIHSLSQETEDSLKSIIEIRREACSSLTSLWRKWGGEAIPELLPSLLQIAFAELASLAQRGYTDSSHQALLFAAERKVESLVFVLSAMLEGAENVYSGYLRTDDDEEDSLQALRQEEGSCVQPGAQLLGPPSPVITINLSELGNVSRVPGSTGVGSDSTSAQLQVWYGCVGLLLDRMMSLGLGFRLVVVSVARVWIYAPAIIRPFLDAFTDGVSLQLTHGIQTSTELLHSALEVCCVALQIHPALGSKAISEIVSGLRRHVEILSSDFTEYLLTTIRNTRLDPMSKLGHVMRTEVKVVERLFNALIKFICLIQPDHTRDKAIYEVFNLIILDLEHVCSTEVVKNDISTLPRARAEDIRCSLASLKGVLHGWREEDEDIILKYIAPLTRSLLKIVEAAHMNIINNCRAESEMLLIIDQTTATLSIVLERPLSIEILTETIACCMRVLPYHFVAGLPTLVTVLVRWGSEHDSMIPSIASLVSACFQTSLPRLLTTETSPEDEPNIGYLEYLGVCCRIIRQACKTIPDALALEDGALCRLIIDFSIQILQRESLISNHKLFRALVASLSDFRRLSGPAQSHIQSMLFDRMVDIIGPILWNLFFGSLERMAVISASLVDVILVMPQLMSADQYQQYMHQLFQDLSGRMCAAVPNVETVVFSKKQDERPENICMTLHNLIEVVCCSIMVTITSKAVSIKACLVDAVKLIRASRDDALRTLEVETFASFPNLLIPKYT